MAYLPINANLLKNVVNDVAGFYLEDRFFFTPGFPSMSQNMVIEALDKLYPKALKEKYRKVMTINCSENDLIDIMKKIPKHLDFSSLPKIINEDRKVVISISGYNKEEVDEYFQNFIDFCIQFRKDYVLEDIFKK
jgi:molybdopterin-biosynthesis enzyme MoeA-like protein